MGALTPIFELPYPTGSDPPCDGAAAVQALAERYDDLVDAVDADLARLRQPPMVHATALGRFYEFPGGPIAPLSIVDVDVGGWTRQLSTYPDRLYFPRAGHYVLGANARVAPQFELNLLQPSWELRLEVADAAGHMTDFTGSQVENPMLWVAGYCTAAAGDHFRCLIEPSRGGDMFEASLWAFWVADP